MELLPVEILEIIAFGTHMHAYAQLYILRQTCKGFLRIPSKFSRAETSRGGAGDRLMRHAIDCNSPGLVHWFASVPGDSFTIAYAAKIEAADAITALLSVGYSTSTCALYRAVMTGHVPTAEAVRGNLHLVHEAMMIAIVHGHKDMTAWLVKQGCGYRIREVLEAIIANKHTHLLPLFDHVAYAPDLFYEAGVAGLIDMLDWLYERTTQRELRFAFVPTNIPAIRWYHAHGCPEQAVIRAVTREPVETIAGACAVVGRVKVASAAIAANRPDVYEWALASGEKLTRQLFADSVYLGFHAVKRLHAAGCPMDARACVRAIESNSPEILRWLVGVGCPVDSSCMRVVNSHTGQDRIEFLRALGAWS